MNTLNIAISALSDRVMSFCSGWPPVVTLVVLSAVSGVLMAWAFRLTSAQDKLRRMASLGRAQVLAIKLFKDDLRTTLVCLGRLFRCTGLRLWYSLPPVLVMTVPFVLLLAQLARWYEHRPLRPGETAIVELKTSVNDWRAMRNLLLEAPPQIDVETEAHRDEKAQTVSWRIRAKEPVAGQLRWSLETRQFEKHIVVVGGADRFGAVCVRRPGAGWWDQLLYPGEGAFHTESPVQGITVHHPRRSTPLFGLNLPWWATFFVVSILAAMLMRPLIKVQF